MMRTPKALLPGPSPPNIPMELTGRAADHCPESLFPGQHIVAHWGARRPALPRDRSASAASRPFFSSRSVACREGDTINPTSSPATRLRLLKPLGGDWVL